MRIFNSGRNTACECTGACAIYVADFVCVEDVYGGRLGGAENTAGSQRQRSRSRQTQNQRYDTGCYLIFWFSALHFLRCLKQRNKFIVSSFSKYRYCSSMRALLEHFVIFDINRSCTLRCLFPFFMSNYYD
jgi:hypothetical protein